MFCNLIIGFIILLDIDPVLSENDSGAEFGCNAPLTCIYEPCVKEKKGNPHCVAVLVAIFIFHTHIDSSDGLLHKLM